MHRVGAGLESIGRALAHVPANSLRTGRDRLVGYPVHRRADLADHPVRRLRGAVDVVARPIPGVADGAGHRLAGGLGRVQPVPDPVRQCLMGTGGQAVHGTHGPPGPAARGQGMLLGRGRVGRLCAAHPGPGAFQRGRLLCGRGCRCRRGLRGGPGRPGLGVRLARLDAAVRLAPQIHPRVRRRGANVAHRQPATARGGPGGVAASGMPPLTLQSPRPWTAQPAPCLSCGGPPSDGTGCCPAPRSSARHPRTPGNGRLSPRPA